MKKRVERDESSKIARLPLFIVHFSLFICFACTNPLMERLFVTDEGTTTVTYTVKFNSNGGSPVPSQKVAKGEKATRPADPTNGDGSYFVDWYSDEDLTTLYDFETPVLADITLYAEWTDTSFTVSFNSNGGIPEPPPQTRGAGGRAEEPNPPPEKTGFKFGGWFREADFITAWDFNTDTLTDDITLYAKWLQIFTVSFDSGDGGSPVQSQEVAEGELADKPDDPERLFVTVAGLYEGSPDDFEYIFDGWFDEDNNPYSFDAPVTGDIALTAKWIVPVDSFVPIAEVAANSVSAAVSYIIIPANVGIYTLLIDKDVTEGAQTLSAGNLTIMGIGAERTIQYKPDEDAGPGATFFIINNANASLTLGNYITLRGTSSNTPLMNVTGGGGTLTMKAGSKITGHTNQEANSVVFINGADAKFIMEGGEISGNNTIYTLVDSTGGVSLGNGGTFTMSGGTISGNLFGSDPGDLVIRGSATFTLSGNAHIGTILLLADIVNDTSTPITLSEYTNTSPTVIHLSSVGDDISPSDTIAYWSDPDVKIIIGNNLSANDINKFTLGEQFYALRYRDYTTPSASSTGYYIGTAGADIGKLLKVSIPVTGVTLNKTAMTMSVGGEETLSATVAPATASNNSVTWKSEDNLVATVIDGLVKAIKRGTTTITVTTVESNFTATCTVTVYGGTGGELTPYEIWDETDLRRVGTETDGWTLSVHYKLMADIDLSGKDLWSPIGSLSTPFIGSFDGNIKKITGLTNTDQASTYQGMFGYVGSNARVKNLALVDVSISSSLNYAGGIAGYSNALIENCSVSGTGNVSGNTSVGGVVGYNNSGTVQNCYATITVSGIAENIGGVVGYNSGTVQNCYATGTVSGISNIGGVVGNNSTNGTVQNCYATGKVTGDANVGGVVGNNFSSVTNCVALNADIVITGTATTNGRVTGTTGGTRSNNYARNDMQKGGTYYDWPNRIADANNGADITAEHYSLDSWWKGISPDGPAFDFASGTWDWHSANKLPILNGFAEGTQNPKVTAFTTGGIIITFEEITDIPDIDGGTIYRTGAKKTITFTLANPSLYTNPVWTIERVGLTPFELSTTSSCTVDATNIAYNSLGKHAVHLVVYKGGVPYSKTIWVTIVESEDEEDFGAGASITQTFNVATTAEWNSALSAITSGINATNIKNYVINVTADFAVTGSNAPNYTITFPRYTRVSLRGVGKTLTLSGEGNLIRIGHPTTNNLSNQTVILRDLNLRGNSENNSSVVFISGVNSTDCSSFIMRSGKITDNTSSSTSGGGGVYVVGSGIFTMYGGEISGNKTTSSSGGGVNVNSGTFRLVTGTIYGSDETNISLRNTSNTSGDALFINGTNAQRGTFSGTTWIQIPPNLATTNNTIRVVDGVQK